MKKILFCCLLGIISITANAGNPKRVILIALDGISINGFTKANTPHLFVKRRSLIAKHTGGHAVCDTAQLDKSSYR